MGIANALARQDHIHAHGNQGNGTQHTTATTSVDGFMSAADKVKLDGVQNPLSLLSTTTYTTTSSTTFTVVSNLQITATSGNFYKFKMYLRYASAATATGICVSISGTSSGSIIAQATGATTTTATQSYRLNSFATPLQFTAAPSTSPELVMIEGIFVCTGTGTMYPQFRSETNGVQMQVLNNSFIEYVEI